MATLTTPEPQSHSGAAPRRKVRRTHAGPLPPVARASQSARARADDRVRVMALRLGDEAAFTALVNQYHSQLLRFARTYVRDQQVAEEVVQETWIAVMQGIDGFEGRSSLKTWLFRILANIAIKRGVRESRSIPFSALPTRDDHGDEGLDPERFLPDGHTWAGHWAAAPSSWGPAPLERLLAGEAQGIIHETIATLPDAQRQVMTLRDLDGWDSDEVCELLSLSEGNQRVLLHRARTKVRAALEQYFASGDEPR